MEPAAPYYGNIVRKLFILCGLVILITLPFLKSLITGPIFYSLLIVIVLALSAGITSARYKKTILVDVIISALGFSFFAYQGIKNFSGFVNLFFITNLVLAIIFLFAFYWSIKTARELKFPKKTDANRDRVTKNGRTIVNANEDTLTVHHKELSEEDRRRNRFLGAED